MPVSLDRGDGLGLEQQRSRYYCGKAHGAVCFPVERGACVSSRLLTLKVSK